MYYVTASRRRIAALVLICGFGFMTLGCSQGVSEEAVNASEPRSASAQPVSGDGPPASGRPGTPTLVAELATRSRSTLVAGRLEPRGRISHAPPFSGFVREVFVEPGDRVAAGAELYRIERDEVARGFRPVVVTARIAGRVSAVDIEIEQLVSPSSPGVVVLNDSEYTLEAQISDKDAFHVEVGQSVQAEAANGTRVEGRLVQRSQEPDYESGLFTLQFRFPAGESLTIGSFLLIELPTERFSGVFAPRAALERRLGRHFLWIVDQDTQELELREVELGESVGDETLVVEGVEVGEHFLARLTGREREGASANSRGSARRDG